MHSFLLITLSVSSWKDTGCDDDQYSSLLGYGSSIHLVFVMHSFLLKHSSISSRKGTGCDDDHYSSLLDDGYYMQLVLVMHYFFLKRSLCILRERYRMWWRPLLFFPWLWLFYTHCKKELAIFPSPAGMSLTKLSLAGKKLNYSRPGRVWSVTSRLGTGKRLTLFYSAASLQYAYISPDHS